MSKQSLRKDFYKILRVSRTATTMEIKAAYRQLALSLHPDRHDGCNDKTKLFKEASEAYTVLVNNESRKEYDMETGFVPNGWYNKNRRRPPPSNYRKVYAPHPPPDGKWNDAQRHYDMHYGDGQYNETIRNSFNRSKRNGEFDYHSPLGKGFTFDHHYSSSSSSSHNYRPFTSNNNNGNNEEEKLNPYSKSKQGPPVQQYMYEEQKGSLNEADNILKRKNGVKSKLHERRQERLTKQQQQQQQQQQKANIPGQKVYKAFNEQEEIMVEGGSGSGGGGGCTIM